MRRRILIRFPWFTLQGRAEDSTFLAVVRCRAAMFLHELVELMFGSRFAHRMRSARRYAIGASGAPYALTIPAGYEVEASEGRYGQFIGKIRDVVWTSDGSNETADATIEATDLSMTVLIGALYLGDSGDDYSSTDTVGMLTITRSSGDLLLSGLTAGGSALDLDSTNVAAARVLFLGY